MKLPQIKSRIDIAHYFTPAYNKYPTFSEKSFPEQNSSLSMVRDRMPQLQLGEIKNNTARNSKIHET